MLSWKKNLKLYENLYMCLMKFSYSCSNLDGLLFSYWH
jgi:hypothetical protein